MLLIKECNNYQKFALKMRMKMAGTLLFLYVSQATAQIDNTERRFSEWRNYFSIDTLNFNSRKIKLIYTLERTNDLKDKIFGQGDLIFNDSVNRVSKLFLIDEHYHIDSVSTIPIDNIVIDDSKELILCLSRAEISPYHIVLYNFHGKLLFKKKISPFELVLDSTNYVRFRTSFPHFFEYAIAHDEINKYNNLYHIDLNYWNHLSESQKKQIKQSNWLKPSRYFNVFPEKLDGSSPIELTKYAGFYSQTDPLYKFKMQNSKIIGIILNDEYGGKVTIPINCFLNR